MSRGASSAMPPAPLLALSALDGRYHAQTTDLAACFSEAALIRRRLHIEIAWLRTVVPHLAPDKDTAVGRDGLTAIEAVVDADDTAAAVKALEAETGHDVKAVEYWLAEQLETRGLAALRPYVHFACTSWDINNIAFSLQVTAAVRDCLTPPLEKLLRLLEARAEAFADLPMLSRTHGQAASPTTVGKEFANFTARLAPRLARLQALRLPAKFNGAVGNYNAHLIAAPDSDWLDISRRFVESWGLRFTAMTTQIEPYDDLAELFDLLRRLNTILLDFCRDCWGYIGLDYFLQQTAGGKETGSSTMPHKINPIDFENAEGNLGVANALFAHFGDKLPVSRWQRDLSDSTVLRSVGSAFGHTVLAWRAVEKGLSKIEPNRQRLAADLEANWQILAEAAQTILRLEGCGDGYERLKEFSRGKTVDADKMRAFIADLEISAAAKARLAALTPATYCGMAAALARTK